MDALFSRFDLTDRAGYAAFLRAQAGAFLPVERALEAAGVSSVIPDWDQRRRAEALEDDLSALGLKAVAGVRSPMFVDEAQILGGVYVLEGSRLGGALLRRSVPRHQPLLFLSAGTAELWRTFVTLLDRRLNASALVDDATASALATFAAFERSALVVLETHRP